MGHVIFLSQALSIGMEDKFLPSMQQPNQGCLRFITVYGAGNVGGGRSLAHIQDVAQRCLSGVIAALTWTKVGKRTHLVQNLEVFLKVDHSALY